MCLPSQACSKPFAETSLPNKYFAPDRNVGNGKRKSHSILSNRYGSLMRRFHGAANTVMNERTSVAILASNLTVFILSAVGAFSSRRLKMAPKGAPKVKKNTAVELLKVALAQHGFPLTAAGISQLQDKEGSKATKPVVDAISYAVKRLPEGLDHWKSLKGDDRFSHIERFCLDPASAGMKCTGSNTISTGRDEQQGWKFADLTQSQLASPTWLNDEAHAEAIVKTLQEAGEAPGSSASRRIVLYRYWWYAGSDVIKRSELATATATADMDPEAFASSRDSMRSVMRIEAEPELKKARTEAIGLGHNSIRFAITHQPINGKRLV